MIGLWRPRNGLGRPRVGADSNWAARGRPRGGPRRKASASGAEGGNRIPTSL